MLSIWPEISRPHAWAQGRVDDPADGGRQGKVRVVAHGSLSSVSVYALQKILYVRNMLYKYVHRCTCTYIHTYIHDELRAEMRKCAGHKITNSERVMTARICKR